MVQIVVSDTGHGMQPSVSQRVFEPFFTTKPPGEGTGLGLSVSYGIIQTHGGTISVESTPDVGSTFTILLPLLAAETP
jgi:signal transduction histidine kinase